jgi:hypothetical protein
MQMAQRKRIKTKQWLLASEFCECENSPKICVFGEYSPELLTFAKPFCADSPDSPDSPTFAKPCCADLPDLQKASLASVTRIWRVWQIW